MPPAAFQCTILDHLNHNTSCHKPPGRRNSVRRAVRHLGARTGFVICDGQIEIVGAAERSEGSLTTDWRKLHGNFAVASDEVLDEAYQRVFGSPRRRPFTQIEWRPNLDVPPSWRWVSVDQVVAQVQYGSSAKTSDDADGVPVLRMGNIQRGELDWTDLKFLPTKHSEFPNLLLEVGDILFNRTNSFELVGKTAVCRVLDRPASFASYLIRLKPSGILPELLSTYLNSPIGRSWVERVASQQVGQANVNGSKLRALGIPLPPFEEQVEMVRRLNVLARAVPSKPAPTRALHTVECAIFAKACRANYSKTRTTSTPVSCSNESAPSGPSHQNRSGAAARRPDGDATDPASALGTLSHQDLNRDGPPIEVAIRSLSIASRARRTWSCAFARVRRCSGA